MVAGRINIGPYVFPYSDNGVVRDDVENCPDEPNADQSDCDKDSLRRDLCENPKFE